MSDDEALFKAPRKSGNKNKFKRKLNLEEEDDEDINEGRRTVSATDIKLAKKYGKRLVNGGIDGAKSKKDEDLSDMLAVAYKTSGTAATLYDSAATRTIELDAIAGSDAAVSLDVLAGDQALISDQIYTGASQYKEFINKRKVKVNQSNAGSLRAGPLRALSGVRVSSRFDYAPAICKDYKETGFCGFGDSCVFMHDRGDYKMGWQLDKEWEEQQKRDAEENDPNKYFIDDDESRQVQDTVESDDDLPFACLICRKDFTAPVVTKCKHYFCEICALKHFAKTPACFACNANTGGVFDVAKDITAKIKAKRMRMDERAAILAASKIDHHQDDDEQDDQDDGERENQDGE